MTERPTPRRRPMVGWFDPRVLSHSAYLVAIANIFGRHSDTRLIEALASQPQNEFDYSHAPGDFWLDYVADTGDGWNPTYAIADALAQPELEVAGEKTLAGRVLIFGGDAVYPYPTRAEYDMRTETPYKLAFAGRARPGRIRDSRQSRLVRQPDRVLAHVLPARAWLRDLPNPADAQLLCAEAARELVAARYRSAARRGSR